MQLVGKWGFTSTAERIYALVRGELPEFTCLVGTMTQEVSGTHPAILEACHGSISGQALTLVPEIEAAIEKYRKYGDWTTETLAFFR